jgi:hypothetical protein
MIGSDVEQDGNLAIEAVRQVDLEGGEFEHIHAALR